MRVLNLDLRELQRRINQSIVGDNCFEHYVSFINVPFALLHCGAHLGEENSLYRKFGVIELFWNEAQPGCVNDLKRIFGQRNVFEGVVSDKENIVVDFFPTDNSLSSGTRRIREDNIWGIRSLAPIKLRTITLNRILLNIFLEIRQLPELIILDLQGGEFEALKAAKVAFDHEIDFIVEMSDFELYEGQKIDSEVVNLLTEHGYKKVWPIGTTGHYEALFLSRKSFRHYNSLSNKIRRKYARFAFNVMKSIKRLLEKINYELARLHKNRV